MPSKKPTPSNGEDFVARVVRDPASPPRVQLLSGFPGASAEEGHTRLYFEARLSRWADVPDDAILHRQEIPAASSPLGGSYLWVEQDAELIHGGTGAPASEGSFLGASPAEATGAAAPTPPGPPQYMTVQQCSVYPGPGGPQPAAYPPQPGAYPQAQAPPAAPFFVTFQQCSVPPQPPGPPFYVTFQQCSVPPQPPGPPFYVTFQQCSVPPQPPGPPNYVTFQQCSVPPYRPYGG